MKLICGLAILAVSILGHSCKTPHASTESNLESKAPIVGTSTITDQPELLPLNSELEVDKVADALCEVKNRYARNAGNLRGDIGRCYFITPASWSRIMSAFYCQHPIFEDATSKVPSVRACFTGTIQKRDPYKKQIKHYRKAFDACLKGVLADEFKDIRATSERQEMFQYIMLSQIEDPKKGELYPVANGKPRFTLASQDEAIEKATKKCGLLTPR